MGFIRKIDTRETPPPTMLENIDPAVVAVRDRRLLEEGYIKAHRMHWEKYGAEIINKGRIDEFITGILDYQLKDFHQDLADFQDIHDLALILAPRGSGKSTILTISRAVWEIIKNPNIRILLISKTAKQAESFLTSIKEHLENNEKLISAYGPQRGFKWSNREIHVRDRKSFEKEANVTAMGVGGPVTGGHYDLILLDDIIDEDNARTAMQRERIQTWFYKALKPTLEPNGRMWIMGTRYYPNDLYGHILKSDKRFKVVVAPAILPDGRALWPEKMSIQWLEAERRGSTKASFDSQYMNNVDAMEGKIFKYEDIQWYEVLPPKLTIYQGVDLAIGLREQNDYFSIATIGKDEYNNVYLLDIFRDRLTFMQQTKLIEQKFQQYDPMRVFIESNVYQNAQVQVTLATTDVRARPIITMKDKVTRAWHLAHKFEAGQVFFPKWGANKFVDELIEFPDGKHDDMFDAFEFAVMGGTKRQKKPRREFGLI